MAKRKKSAERAAKKARSHPKLAAAIAVAMALIIVAAIVVYIVKPEIYHKYFGIGSHTFSSDGICTVCGFDGNYLATDEEVAQADFTVHFPELGNGYAGDCILIDCGDTEALIDAGSRPGSASVIEKYVDKYCADGTIEYVITTHADQDHIAAYAGNSTAEGRDGILYKYSVGTIIKFALTGKDTQVYKNYMSAVAYAQERGTKVYTAAQCYYETDGAQRQYYLDEGHTLSLNILYNYYYENKSSDENNYSVVTLLTKQTSAGKKHFLFTGDLEKDGEEKLVEYYSNPVNSKSEYDVLPEVELYKAGHHGSRTSSNASFIDIIKPQNVVVCCVAGSPEYTLNNLNTFPTQEMLDHVGKYTDKIFVTSLATNLPELEGGISGKFKSDEYSYSSMNGNIVFCLVNGKAKANCSADGTLLKNTEWFSKYRKWNGV